MASKPVIIDATCPGCKKDHAVAVPLDDLNIAMGRVQQDEPKAPNIEELVSKEVERRLPKEKPEVKEKVIEKVKQPKWLPKKACSNGSCMNDHTSEDYQEKVTKRCANGSCNQYAPAKAARCLWCDSKDEDGKDLPQDERFEELDEDELAKIPAPKSHAHHHHEDE